VTSDRLRRRLRDARARQLTAQELAADALVLAPHPDDEVLGCGGTVIRKRDSGARVRIAWLTDGRKSHAHLIDAQELASLRREEARCAAERLGVAGEDTVMLDFENGKLAEQQAAAAAAVAAVVSEHRPDQVLLPCPWDVWPDHLATTECGRALRASGYEGRLLGYPIWFWDRWPWTARRVGARPPRTALRALAGHWRLWREFRLMVDISDVLERKRDALRCHRTQMERLNDDPRWVTLAEVGEGRLLRLLLESPEMFVELP
jgi:LmbE family N-acetylglucosaminyl deacetylase